MHPEEKLMNLLFLSGFYQRDVRPMLERSLPLRQQRTYDQSFRSSVRHEPEPVLYQNEEI